MPGRVGFRRGCACEPAVNTRGEKSRVKANNIARWFGRYNQREQLSLLLLALVLVVYLAYQLLWLPLSNLQQQARERNAQLSGVHDRVEQMVASIRGLEASGDSTRRDRNLTAVVNASTAAYGLKILRLQPNNRGEVQIRLENAVFDDLVAWLYRLESTEGLATREVAVSQAAATGRVNATIRIGQ